MLISLMKEEEIPQVAALEQVCFSEPWTEQGLRESFARPEYLFVTATEGDQVVGYAGLYQVVDEGAVCQKKRDRNGADPCTYRSR